MQKIGLGGSCHWCTEGIFSSVIGVSNVQQGWVSAAPPNEVFSEAILLDYDPAVIGLMDLIALHLHSHSCTSAHSMREKYRSAIYVFDSTQEQASREAISGLQEEFEAAILTEILPYQAFKLNISEQLDYYHSNPQKPFCKTYIDPKLRKLMQRYTSMIDPERTKHLRTQQ